MKWIIDTDIGDDIDDLFAIGYALACKLDIIGITTVFRSCKLRAKLAKYAVEQYGYNISVYAGEDNPINTPVDAFCKPERWLCDELYQKHLKTGEKWLPQMIEEANDCSIERFSAVDFIGECAKKYGEELGIIAIGPLTNLARTIEKYPEMQKVGAFYIMGGNFSEQKCEWNVKLDVEAVEIVYKAKVPKFIVGADKTWDNATFDYERFKNGLSASQKAKELEIKSVEKWKKQPLYSKRNPCMHDVIVIDAIANPKEYCFEKCDVNLIVEGDMRGATIREKEKNCQSDQINVLVDMDEKRFKENFLNAMKLL